MLFNVLIGFVFLFLLAFMMVNPETKRADIPSKAEIIVLLEWDDESIDDIDLWITGDMPKPLSWQIKQSGYWHLDRDDLGQSNDTAVIDGETMILKYNKEVATMRGNMPGDFFINVHVYAKKEKNPVKFKVTLIDVNPYSEPLQINEIATEQAQVFVLPGFSVDGDGNITKVFHNDKHFAATRTGMKEIPDVLYFEIPNKVRQFATGGE
jgi:hypothetical protein